MNHPLAAYELAYSYRNLAAECDFLVAAAERSLGYPPRSALELGAGPAGHGRLLARRGLEVWALDHDVAALAYLADVAPALHRLEADLRGYTLPAPVDLVYCPLSTFAYLLNEGDWAAGLACAATALNPRGAIVLEFALADQDDAQDRSWHVEEGSLRVSATATAAAPDGADVFAWTLQLDWRDGEQGGRCSSWQRQRRLTPGWVERQLRAGGVFGEVGLYGGWSMRRRWRGHSTLVVVATRR